MLCLLGRLTFPDFMTPEHSPDLDLSADKFWFLRDLWSNKSARCFLGHTCALNETPVRLDVYICSLAPIFTTISVLGINPGHSHHTAWGASRSGLSHAPCPPRWNSARCPQRAHWRITRHTNSGAGLIAVGTPAAACHTRDKSASRWEFRARNSGSPPTARM